jgi:polyferredoxin
MSARIFNVLLGTWLFLSAFAWAHTPAQGLITLAGGALTLLTALVSIYYPRVRYLTALLAVLLFVASLATAGMSQTFWHNAVCAIAIFIAAMFDRGTVGLRVRDHHDELRYEPEGPDPLRRPIGPEPRSPASRA